MQKYRQLTRWIQNAFERHFIRTYSCCIQIVSVKVCVYDSTRGNLNIQLRVPVNPWHTLSTSFDTGSLKTNVSKQAKLWSFSLSTHKIYLNKNTQHDLKDKFYKLCAAEHLNQHCNLNVFAERGTITIRILETESTVSWPTASQQMQMMEV